MGYLLREGVSFCLAGGRVVLLDLLGDRYFCLDSEADITLQTLARAEALTSADEPSIRSLVSQGLLVSAGSAAVPTACMLPTIATRSVVDEPGLSSGALEFLIALRLLAFASVRLRYQPLHEIAKVIGRLKVAKAGSHRNARILQVVTAFRRSNWLLSAHDQCLPRSIAMTMRLAHLGLEPDLIFGVSMRPFRSHCWVQVSDIVINDRLDNIRNFTPILVL